MPGSPLRQIPRHDTKVFTSRVKVAAGNLWQWVMKIVASVHGHHELHFRVLLDIEPLGDLEPDPAPEPNAGA